MTFKNHMFHKCKNELKKLLVKLSRSLTAQLYINIAQTLPAKPGGNADRGYTFSFLYQPAEKLVAVGNAHCRTRWTDLSGACQNCFLQYYIAFGASPNCWQPVQSQHWCLPPRGVGTGGKAQPGKQSYARGKWAAGGESRPPAFAAERVILCRHVSPKQLGKWKEARHR